MITVHDETRTRHHYCPTSTKRGTRPEGRAPRVRDYLASTRTRTAAVTTVTVVESRTTGAQVTDLAGEFSLEALFEGRHRS